MFATECLRKIIVVCEEDGRHFNLEQARYAKKDTGGEPKLLIYKSALCLENCPSDCTYFRQTEIRMTMVMFL